MTNPGGVDERLLERLRKAKARFADIDLELASPEVIRDLDRLRVLGQERSELAPRVGLADQVLGLIDEHEGACELLRETDDPEMRKMAAEEVAAPPAPRGRINNAMSFEYVACVHEISRATGNILEIYWKT